MTSQHLIEVLTDGPIQPGITVAHRRTVSAPPEKPWPGQTYDGTPTSPWPACMPMPAGRANGDGRWREHSAGRALELGAVPCTKSACTEAVAK